ncbi:M24 family metallopeptidase [Aestuariivirga sp.]|uniref:M24 family metallopeptidase n=1 Tax=Aestuariivirga sp. TaxID=2650926 RepID=UPI003BABEA25
MQPRSSSFPKSEHHARFVRARRMLKENGFEACVMVAPENVYYFGGYESWVGVNSPQFMIFGVEDGEPTLVLRNVDLALALETSWIGDIRTYHLHTDSVADLVTSVLKEKGSTGGRIAIETQSYALSFAMGRHLAEALAPREIVDATELLGDLRLIKSPAELARIEEAARFSALGLAEAHRVCRAGMTEIELAAAIEGAMRHAGSDYWAIPTELASGWRTPGGHATPRPKVIEPGDLLHVEFAGVSARYHTTVLQTLAVGEPGPRARELYDIALLSLRAGMAAVKEGVPVSAVEEASLVPLRREGLEHTAMMRFGYGIGIAYPPVWLETLQISRGFERRLEKDMVFVLHSCIELPEEGIGIVQGGTYHLGASGLRMLAGAGDVGLHIL